MAWTTLAAADVLTEFNSSEKTNIVNIVGTDNLTAITARVVEEVRGACLAGGNQVGAELTIPSQLVGDAICIAKWRFLLALPQFPSLQTKQRESAFNQSRKVIADVAHAEMRVELPAAGTALPMQSPANSLEISDDVQPRFVTRTTMDGL